MTLIVINIKSLLMLAILAIIAVSCAKIFSKGASNTKALAAFSNVGVDEFQTFIANPVVQLLDVRTRDEDARDDEGHEHEETQAYAALPCAHLVGRIGQRYSSPSVRIAG